MMATDEPFRLGFPVTITGDESLKSHDARRSQNDPHLKVSLELLDQVLDYLARNRIRMYRLSSDIAPYATHPDMPRFHAMVAESDAELRAFGAKARALDVRLSFHPSQFVLLNSPDPDLTKKSVWDLSSQAEMLDRMGLGDEAVVVTHVGGVYGDHEASRARWIKGWDRCPQHVRRRLVLEHDDVRFSAADVLWINERTGVRCIFDYQHFWCLNPEELSIREALERILGTWPSEIRPKIHFSSPRTEFREVSAPKAKTGTKQPSGAAKQQTWRQASWTNHADFINPFEFCTFMRMADGLAFDVMLEAKAKDAALLRLREDLGRFAPDVAIRFGLT
jgi:UV DNA damage endonuclease